MFKKIIVPGILAGLVNFLASMVINQVFGILFPAMSAEYQNPNLFRSQSDPLMLLFFVYPFLLGIILAWFWTRVKSVFGQDIKGALKFGLAYWLVATLPGMFITYSSMPYSLPMVMSWLMQGLAIGILSGIIFSKLIKDNVN